VLNVPACIVIGSDSSVDIHSPRPISENIEDGVTVRKLEYDWWRTQTAQAVFLTSNRIGIVVRGWPDPHHIEEFIRVGLLGHESVHEVAVKLQKYIISLYDNAFGGFHVAGYEFEDGHYHSKVYRGLFTGGPESIEEYTGCMSYAGHIEVIDRLIQAVETGDKSNYPAPDCPYRYFTMQDAVDFVDYLISATKGFYRFTYGTNKPGGPTQLLVLTPSEAIWVARHEITRGTEFERQSLFGAPRVQR
jgi:hypothetical protein